MLLKHFMRLSMLYVEGYLPLYYTWLNSWKDELNWRRIKSGGNSHMNIHFKFIHNIKIQKIILNETKYEMTYLLIIFTETKDMDWACHFNHSSKSHEMVIYYTIKWNVYILFLSHWLVSCFEFLLFCFEIEICYRDFICFKWLFWLSFIIHFWIGLFIVQLYIHFYLRLCMLLS